MRFKPACTGQPGLFMWLRMWSTVTVKLNLLKSKVTVSLSSAGLRQSTVLSAGQINVRYNLPRMKSTWQTREISGGCCMHAHLVLIRKLSCFESNQTEVCPADSSSAFKHKNSTDGREQRKWHKEFWWARMLCCHSTLSCMALWIDQGAHSTPALEFQLLFRIRVGVD